MFILLQGAASFLKKTVFGISDSMTKFTSSVGKGIQAQSQSGNCRTQRADIPLGLSAATFDAEYQARRRMNQRRNRPRHAMLVLSLSESCFIDILTDMVLLPAERPLRVASPAPLRVSWCVC